MTNLKKFGAHILMGISGTRLDDLDKKLLQEVHPAGILLLKRNIAQDLPYAEWLGTLSELLKEIKDYAERDKIILSIDHEGGAVQRVPAPITNFGTPATYANHVKEVAKAMAIELCSIGVNLSWAPLADINTNPENPIIGKLGRAFSEKPEVVAKYDVEFAEEIMANGIFACAKHFPGHGDTWADSHLELPSVPLTLEEARKRELVPFQALVNIGIPFVMTAHVMFPNIDKENPATFSKLILNDVLREEMGYEGVIIADDVNMAAVADRFQSAEGVAKSFNAGCDMFIVGRWPSPDVDESPLRLSQALADSLKKGIISADRLEISAARVNAILSTIPDNTVQKLDAKVFDSHAKLAEKIRKESEK